MFLLYNAAHLSYWASSAANQLVGGALSFALNKRFTFRSEGWSWGELGRFALTAAACWLAAYGLARPLALRALAGAAPAVQDNAAMLAGMCAYTALNYLGQRFFAFREG
jgi:putative flippase GtrA